MLLCDVVCCGVLVCVVVCGSSFDVCWSLVTICCQWFVLCVSFVVSRSCGVGRSSFVFVGCWLLCVVWCVVYVVFLLVLGCCLLIVVR